MSLNSLNNVEFLRGFSIPATQNTCPNLSCPRDKTIQLAPNPTLTGNQIWNTFVLTSIIVAGSSVVIAILELMALKMRNRGKRFRDEAWRRWYLKVHLQEVIIMLSDQQTTVGIGLLVAVAHQGCTVTAYQYNCICYLVIMAVCSNLLAILNVRNFFLGRGYRFAFIHIATLATLIALSGNMIFARGSRTFPVKAGPEQTLPAACFQSGDYINVDGIQTGFKDLLGSGQIQFILFLLFVALTMVLLIFEGFRHMGKRPYAWYEKTTLVFRCIFSVLATGVLIYLLINYLILRYTTETNPMLYDKSSSNTAWNMSNVLAWAFWAKAMIMAVTKINETPAVRSLETKTARDEFDANDGSKGPLVLGQEWDPN
ncbi:hypothetical protein VTL71DRAFT_16148 [Oculimacula yallundae]|uniref:Uncharacterized protein n=1 Tax=Oculimacula yallundae TaxID=86028 RepID=A0ABR4CE78_9HELO